VGVVLMHAVDVVAAVGYPTSLTFLAGIAKMTSLCFDSCSRHIDQMHQVSDAFTI
jgi:hypothetical protein